MADGASQILRPKEAIALGKKYFEELMEDQSPPRVLLEGLELDEDEENWIVTFGFDSQRLKPMRVSPMLEAIERVSGREVEIVREFRSLYLSAKDGKFIKLEHASGCCLIRTLCCF